MPRFLDDGRVAIESVVAGGIGLIVTDIATITAAGPAGTRSIDVSND
jgi:hypothetical protein